MDRHTQEMKRDGLNLLLIFFIGVVAGFLLCLFAKTKHIDPKIAAKTAYQPTQMQCKEFDGNDMIVHGPVKIIFLDPDQFRMEQ